MGIEGSHNTVWKVSLFTKAHTDMEISPTNVKVLFMDKGHAKNQPHRLS